MPIGLEIWDSHHISSMIHGVIGTHQVPIGLEIWDRHHKSNMIHGVILKTLSANSSRNMGHTTYPLLLVV